jgi:hypothetical protein
MEIIMNTTLTRGEALHTVDFAIEQFINEIEIEDNMLEVITYAVNNDLQIRDYFLGLPAQFDMQVCVDFVNYLSRLTNAENCYAYDTISAMYHLELGNATLAEKLLTVAEIANPDYNLTKLAKRVLSAGWPGSAFTAMREELHTKVVAGIQEDPNYVIEDVE